MGRYLAMWEVDQSRVPVDGKEIAVAWSLLLELVKQDIKSGITKDHGTFVGETNGYAIMEGTEVEVTAGLAKYAPYVHFKLHALVSVSQMGEILKKMSG